MTSVLHIRQNHDFNLFFPSFRQKKRFSGVFWLLFFWLTTVNLWHRHGGYFSVSKVEDKKWSPFRIKVINAAGTTFFCQHFITMLNFSIVAGCTWKLHIGYALYMFHSGLAVFHSASSLSIGFHSSLFNFRCRSHIYIGITKYTSDYIS